MTGVAALTREQERQIEVWSLMRPFEMPDLEELAFRKQQQLRAQKREDYRELRVFDPRAYREMVEAQRRRRAVRPGYRRRLRPAEVRELGRMYRAGAPVKAIAKAFGVHERTVSGHVAEDTGGSRRRGEKIRPARGSSHPRWKSTPELLERILRMTGSNRAIARALGVSHKLVAERRKVLSQVGREG